MKIKLKVTPAPNDAELEKMILQIIKKKRSFTIKYLNKKLSPLASTKRISRIIRKLERKGTIKWTGKGWVLLGG